MTCLSGRLLLVSLCATALAQEAPGPRLTARELFYNTQASAAPAAQPVPGKTGSATKPKTQAAKSSASKAVTPSASTAPPPVTVAANGTANLPGGAKIVRAVASSSNAAAQPLGLKYTILKSVGETNEAAEAAPDSVFHSGDHIRFNVETNSTGYLYIFTQGSSGTWQALFPSAAVEGGSNQVEGFHAYTMPPGHRFTFDEQAGTERIFLVLSRVPVPDLEELMYSLKTGRPQPTSDPAKPKTDSQVKTLVASTRIDDSTVGRLRQTYARDLIIEKVDETTPGDRKEKAVYVVNPNGSADSHVVADLLLVHQ